ncbi:O-antigen ligase family protein [Arthrobacter sp. KN11-1C]|uniref:O-antigen ligase family protein n=1 Tax=Arthrobacter sp. KN11-1C TaxID=3445774 RepID=UPI003F9FE6D8
MSGLWIFFLVLAAATAVTFFVLALKRWPVVAAISIAANVLVAWEIPYVPPLVNVGGFSVYFLDIFSFAALVIAVMRFPVLARRLKGALWAWIGIGALLVFSLVSGLLINPFGTTMNEFRPFLQPYATLTWAMCLNWNQETTDLLIRRSSLVLGWSLTIVAAYHFSLHGLGTASELVDAGTGLEQTTRPLVSGQALMVLLCGMMCMWYWRRLRHKSLLISAVAFLTVVIVSQQRTVWAVGVAALLIVFIAARAGTKAVIAVSGLVAAWIVGIILSAQLLPQVVTELESALANSGTYDARVTSWSNLIDQSVFHGPVSVIFGEPMGSGFGRFEGVGRWVVFAPHNWYVTLYLRTGVIGLALFLMFLLIVMFRLLKQRQNMGALGVVSALIVYGWSYSWTWYICAFLGWGISQALNKPSSLHEMQHVESRRPEAMENGVITERRNWR